MLPRVVVPDVVPVPVRSAQLVRVLRQGSERARAPGQMRSRSLRPLVQARVLRPGSVRVLRRWVQGLETVKVNRLRQRVPVRERLPVKAMAHRWLQR